MLEGFLKLMLLTAIGVALGSAVIGGIAGAFVGGLIGEAAGVPVTTTAPIGAVVGAVKQPEPLRGGASGATARGTKTPLTISKPARK